jgi:hypothetical protein
MQWADADFNRFALFAPVRAVQKCKSPLQLRFGLAVKHAVDHESAAADRFGKQSGPL